MLVLTLGVLTLGRARLLTLDGAEGQYFHLHRHQEGQVHLCSSRPRLRIVKHVVGSSYGNLLLCGGGIGPIPKRYAANWPGWRRSR